MSPPRVTSLASRPWLRPDGFVQVDVVVDGVPVTVIVHRSRGAGAPDAPSLELGNAATQFCMGYVQSEPILFHDLFANGSALGHVAAVSLDPVKSSLLFKLVIGGTECEMDVDSKLKPGLIRGPLKDWHETDEGWELQGLAYDTCLAHMKANVSELESLGFDVSGLVRQRAEDVRHAP